MTDADLIRIKAADIALSLMQLCDEAPVDSEDALEQFVTAFGNVERAIREGVVELTDDEDGEMLN